MVGPARGNTRSGVRMFIRDAEDSSLRGRLMRIEVVTIFTDSSASVTQPAKPSRSASPA